MNVLLNQPLTSPKLFVFVGTCWLQTLSLSEAKKVVAFVKGVMLRYTGNSDK